MAGGAQANPGQGQQQPDPLQPPSIKRTLLSMIPVAGPLLAQHSLLNLELKRRREDQQIQAKQAPYALATQFANNEGLDPDTRLQWQQLQADMAIHNEENPTRPYTPDLIKRHQSLLGNTTQQIALKQSQGGQNVPSALQPPQPQTTQNASPLINPQGGFNLTPPPGAPMPPPGAASGMLPQGSSQVGTGPGRPPVQPNPIGLQPPPAQAPMASAQPDAIMDSLNPLLQNPNPLISGPAKNTLNAIQLGRAQMAAKVASVTQQLKAAGQDPSDLSVEAWMDLLGKGEIRPLNPLKPGEQQPSVSGSIIAQNTLPRFETAAPGATPFLLTPPPGSAQPSTAAAPSPAQVPASANAGLPPGVTQLQGAPAQLTPEEAKLLSAAQQVAQKHNIPFDPTKNPRNPFAQIPTRYQSEVSALDAEQKADPQTRATMQAMRNMQMQNIQFQQGQARLRRVDQSYNKSTTDLDKLGKPVDDAIARFGRLQDTISQKSAQADALIAPELLTVMAGGMGSGLRMNEAEISRIVGGRDAWQDLKAKIQKWTPGSGLSVTDSQRDQINRLVKTVYQKLQQKRAILDEANDKLRDSEDVGQHREIVANTRKALTAIDEGPSASALTPPPGVGAKAPPEVVQALAKVGAGIHTLSDGSKWMKASDGSITKQ